MKLQPYKIRQHAAVSNKPTPVRVTIADDAAAVFISPVTHNWRSSGMFQRNVFNLIVNCYNPYTTVLPHWPWVQNILENNDYSRCCAGWCLKSIKPSPKCVFNLEFSFKLYVVNCTVHISYSLALLFNCESLYYHTPTSIGYIIKGVGYMIRFVSLLTRL